MQVLSLTLYLKGVTKMNKVAIYNVDQCRFYIKNGATVLDIKIGNNGKVALIFEKNETYTKLFSQWCERKH